LFDDESAVDALRMALPIRFSLADHAGDTIGAVRSKERALALLNRRGSALSRWKRIADVWCAPWFAASGGAVPAAAFGALSDTILGRGRVLTSRAADSYLATAAAIARSHRLFHWELEFPEVFFDRDGARLPQAGFDAVIGNPPWDMVR